MDVKERLKKLIDNPKQPNVSEWIYEVEVVLEEIEGNHEEAWGLIDRIKFQGCHFNQCDNLIALLRQLYRKKYDSISTPKVRKNNQIFIAM